MKNASELKIGDRAIIIDIDNSHPSFRRILEIGFTPGQEIELISSSIFNDPLAFSLRGTLIAIRKTEARCIIIQ
jgi:ferrous iron transport protein A